MHIEADLLIKAFFLGGVDTGELKLMLPVQLDRDVSKWLLRLSMRMRGAEENQAVKEQKWSDHKRLLRRNRCIVAESIPASLHSEVTA
jgi:hypothetical protein